MSWFQAFIIRRFQHGFHRVSRHRPARVSLLTSPPAFFISFMVFTTVQRRMLKLKATLESIL